MRVYALRWSSFSCCFLYSRTFCQLLSVVVPFVPDYHSGVGLSVGLPVVCELRKVVSQQRRVFMVHLLLEQLRVDEEKAIIQLAVDVWIAVKPFVVNDVLRKGLESLNFSHMGLASARPP